MIKHFKHIGIILLCMLYQNVSASSGLLFHVSSAGTSDNLNITLCLNGQGPSSCQNYDVSALTLNILTTIPNHQYPFAGIKINTSGYKLGNEGTDCIPFKTGYCLFSVSNTSPKEIIVVVDGLLSISPASLPAATVGTAYSQTLTASGGVTPYTYAITSGSLPTGLSLGASTGIISGTPTVANTYSFTVTASDSNANTGPQGYSIVVTAPALSLTTFATTSGVPSATGTLLNTIWNGTLPVLNTASASSSAPGCPSASSGSVTNLNVVFGSAGQTDTSWNPGSSGGAVGNSTINHCVRLCTTFGLTSCTNWIYNAGN